MTTLLERARSKSPYLRGSSAERLIDELAAEVERLTADMTADNHRLMMWNEDIQTTLDGTQDTIAELRADNERLRGVLADIKCGAVNITMAKRMAEVALEAKP